jgi:uncharacterized protein
MRLIHSIFIVLPLVAAVGCASAPSTRTYYLLRGEPIERTSEVDAAIRAGLGRVIVAPYLLSSKGIMVETGAGEINPASHHQWAEPLDAGLRWYLRSEIGKELGRTIGGGLTDRRTWDYTIDVSIARLHGTMSGTALIDAEFAVIPADDSKEISDVRFSKSIPLREEGYAGLVEAEKNLAQELARLIAAELEGRMTLDASKVDAGG